MSKVVPFPGVDDAMIQLAAVRGKLDNLDLMIAIHELGIPAAIHPAAWRTALEALAKAGLLISTQKVHGLTVQVIHLPASTEICA